MKLYLNTTSPFARLVLISILEYKIKKPQLIWTDPWKFSKDLVNINPFSTVPALEIDNENAIYDSLLIINYLIDHFDISLPKDDYLRLSYSKMLLETTFRHVSLVNNSGEEKQHPFIMRTHQMLSNALEILDKHMPNNIDISISNIQLFVALDYINFRLPDLHKKYIGDNIAKISNEYCQRDSFIKTHHNNIKNSFCV